jgi:hypothetical protein
MIGPPSGTRIWLVAGHTDLRKYAVETVMRRVGWPALIFPVGLLIGAAHNAELC